VGRDVLAAAVQQWEDAAGVDILDDGTWTSSALVADVVTSDDVNEIYFGAIDDPGVIAVTITWGFYNGPPRFRELVEFDMVFDNVDFTWSTSPDPADGAMDFENIAQHELGHAIGLSHPDATCTEETMYASAASEETIKRTLALGDINGASKLY
jgi:hypothetical protein